MRGDLFVAAAVWSVAEAYELVQTSKKLKMQNKCPSFNETIGPVGSNEFVKLSMVIVNCYSISRLIIFVFKVADRQTEEKLRFFFHDKYLIIM